mgnify:CR=1 FL=1
MKKILFVLVALMFAAPAWAVVDISMAQVSDSNEVIISITSDEANLVRAYSLDIQLAPYLDSNTPTVLEVTALNPGYWVFPGTIQIDAGGEITNPGSPVAEYGDLPSDTLGGLDSNGVTVELASLYAPVGPSSPNAPVQNGALLSVKVSDDACITVTANVPRAGATGVVMEDPDEVVTVNLPAELCIEVVSGPQECYTGPQIEEWRSVGSPDCWCASINPRQCLGDAVGDAQGRDNYWTSTNDLNVLVAAWNKPYAAIAGQVEPITGTPLICADFDHLPEGRDQYRVSPNDLNILVANWNQANLPGPVCP